ncbi:MFS general substrate transporter [Panus rudis PR-1116 ss-1]|nr:MFS general substrate transporter [Panus rudis PR-1116 ss-1]
MSKLDLEKCETLEGDTSPINSCSVSSQPDDDFPDGGWRAWLTVIGAFLALFCTFGQLTSFGTFQTWYAEHQLRDMSPSTISWIGSLQLWVFFFCGGIVGRIFDAYGPRILMIPGAIILTVGTMLTSICTKYYQYMLCQGVLFGLGIGLLFYPALASVSTHFKKYRATALGLALSGSGVGGVIYPIMFRQLFELCGFAWGVRISGFIGLAASGVAVCLVSSRLGNGNAKSSGSAPWLDLKVIQDGTFLLFVLGCVFVSLGLFIPNFYIVSYATEHSMSSSMSFTVLAVLNAGGILGRVAPPYISDILGRFNMIIPSAFLAGFCTLVFWMFAQTEVEIILYAILYGIFSGAFNALVIPCIGQISDIRVIGLRIGLAYTIIAFPSLCGGPAAGALLKLQHGSYTGLIAFSGSCFIIGSVFFVWARYRLEPRILARH